MTAYRFEFGADIDLDEIRATVLLSEMACESLHGAAAVRLDAKYHVDDAQRRCVVDASTAVGRDLVKLLTGYLAREFGREAFRVHSVEVVPSAEAVVP